MCKPKSKPRTQGDDELRSGTKNYIIVDTTNVENTSIHGEKLMSHTNYEHNDSIEEIVVDCEKQSTQRTSSPIKGEHGYKITSDTPVQEYDKECSRPKDYIVENNKKVGEISQNIVNQESSESVISRIIKCKKRRRSSFRTSLIHMNETKKSESIYKIKTNTTQERPSVNSARKISEEVKPIGCRDRTSDDIIEEKNNNISKCHYHITSQIRELRRNQNNSSLPLMNKVSETRYEVCTQGHPKSLPSVPSTIGKMKSEVIATNRQIEVQLK